MFGKMILSIVLALAALFGSSQCQYLYSSPYAYPAYYPSSSAYAYPSAFAPGYAYAWGSNKAVAPSTSAQSTPSLTNNNI